MSDALKEMRRAVARAATVTAKSFRNILTRPSDMITGEAAWSSKTAESL